MRAPRAMEHNFRRTRTAFEAEAKKAKGCYCQNNNEKSSYIILDETRLPNRKGNTKSRFLKFEKDAPHGVCV